MRVLLLLTILIVAAPASAGEAEVTEYSGTFLAGVPTRGLGTACTLPETDGLTSSCVELPRTFGEDEAHYTYDSPDASLEVCFYDEARTPLGCNPTPITITVPERLVPAGARWMSVSAWLPAPTPTTWTVTLYDHGTE